MMSQLVKKFITDNAVADEKIRLDNDAYIRARNAANSADVNIIKIGSDNLGVLGVITLKPSTNNTHSLGDVGSIFGSVYTGQLDGDGSPITLFSNLIPDTGVSLGSLTAYYQAMYATNFVLQNNTYLQGRNGADSANINVLKVTGSDHVSLESPNDIYLTSTGGDIVHSSSSEVHKLISYNGTVAPSLRLDNAAGTFHVNVKALNALAASYTLTLPANDGASGEFLQTDGSGVLTWAAAGGGTFEKETFTLSAGDITNQYIDLGQVAKTDSIHFIIKGGVPTLEGASHDYSVNYTGGAGGNTRITFLNDLATGGAAALVAADIIQIAYSY